MQQQGHRSASAREEPISVLLVGEHWESAAAAVRALAGQGRFRFSSPIAPASFAEMRTRDTGPAPVVVVVGPGPSTRGIAQDVWQDVWQVIGKASRPGLLDCITHDDLENCNILEEADDFLVAPCTSAELAIRILRLAERASLQQERPSLVVGEIALNPDTYQVTVAGERVGLAWMEFQLLKFLMENVGRVFSRGQLLADVWGVEGFGGTRTVDVHIRRLRNKIETGGCQYFRTVKNVGYGMNNPD